MSITVTGTNPIKISGTSASANTAETVITNIREIQQVVWVQPSTIGHEAILTDAANNVIAHFYCDAANASQQIFLGITVTGINAYNMPSGTIYIY